MPAQIGQPALADDQLAGGHRTASTCAPPGPSCTKLPPTCQPYSAPVSRSVATKPSGRSSVSGRVSSPPACGVGIEVDAHDNRVVSAPLHVSDRAVVCGVDERDVVSRRNTGLDRRISLIAPDQRAEVAVERTPRGSRTSPSRGIPRCRRAAACSPRSNPEYIPHTATASPRAQPRLERRTAAVLKILVQDVRRVDEEVRSKPVGLGDSCSKVLGELGAGVRQVK